MSITYSTKGMIYIVSSKEYLPCLPYEEDVSKTYKIKSGTILKFIGIKEFGYNNNFIIMEVMETGATVLLAMSCEEHLEMIPSRNSYHR